MVSTSAVQPRWASASSTTDDVDRADRAEVLGDHQVGVEPGGARPRRGGRGPRRARIAPDDERVDLGRRQPLRHRRGRDDPSRLRASAGEVALEGHARPRRRRRRSRTGSRSSRGAGRRSARRHLGRRQVARGRPDADRAGPARAGGAGGRVRRRGGRRRRADPAAGAAARAAARGARSRSSPPTSSASICGTTVSSATYYRRVRPDPRTFGPLMAAARSSGSVGGALVASQISARRRSTRSCSSSWSWSAPTCCSGRASVRTTALRYAGHRHVARRDGRPAW